MVTRAKEICNELWQIYAEKVSLAAKIQGGCGTDLHASM